MFCTDRDGRTVEAWQIPDLGGTAAEAIPLWMIKRLSDRSFEITDIGGLVDFSDMADIRYAISGDYVIRYKDDEVLFCSNATFTDTYSLA